MKPTLGIVLLGDCVAQVHQVCSVRACCLYYKRLLIIICIMKAGVGGKPYNCCSSCELLKKNMYVCVCVCVHVWWMC